MGGGGGGGVKLPPQNTQLKGKRERRKVREVAGKGEHNIILPCHLRGIRGWILVIRVCLGEPSASKYTDLSVFLLNSDPKY